MKRYFVGTLLVFYAAAGWAQSTSTSVEELKLPPVPSTTTSIEDTAVKQKKDVERVEVTGSHIKRIDVEGPSPVQTLTRKDLEKTGYNSVSDVLRDTSANTFGSQREESGSNAAGVAHVNLRGLGSSNTLVLLNGQRLPSDAVTGAVDLNLIPMAAIERVEILKDGASATYGSDALGGVVNIITRKDFSGNEASFTQSVPELNGGRKTQISLVNGINKGKANMVNVVQYRDNEKVFSRDRKWSNKGVSPIGDYAAYRNKGGKWMADPNCPAEQIEHTQAGDFCRYKFSDYSTELPALQQLSILSETNYEMNSRWRVKARAGATEKTAQWSFAPAPGSFTIPGSRADNLGPGGGPLPGTKPGEDLEVRYRLQDLGTRDTEITTQAYNLLLGTAIDVSEGVELEVNASHNRIQNRDEGVNGYALTPLLNDAVEGGGHNPFAAPGSRGSLEGTRYKPLEQMVSQLTSAETKISGELGSFHERPIGAAFGTSYTFQKYEDNFDDLSVAGEVFGNAGSSGGGQRDMRAVFTEVSIPLTEKLELQLAGRYDQYSDFGETVNPKAAVLYRATPSVLLRGSAGTGFKAPLMQDLYAATSDGYPTFVDPVACEAERRQGGPTTSCTPQQYHVVSSGNKGLKEEKSISYNIGMLYEPTRDFNLGLDFFHTRLNNVVGIDYGDATEAELKLGNAYLAEKGVIVHRDGDYIDYIEAPLQNLSAQEIYGADLSIGTRIRKVRVGMEHSQMFFFKEEGFPGMGLEDKLTENGKPAYRNAISLDYLMTERHTLGLAGITTGKHQKLVKEYGNLRSYTTFDFQYSYKNKKIGVITAGVKNLMGTTPPLDDSNLNAQLDSALYDQIGRQYYTAYTATF